MTGRELARRRMRNLGLSGSSFEAPHEVVRWHGAMQAQDYGLAKWSVGQRARNLVDEDVDRALAEGSIVRTHVLRPTWHFIARDDARWMLALTAPRVHRYTARRYEELGLDGRTLARSRAAVAAALEGGNHLTRDAIGRILEDAGIDPSGQRLPHILMHCELEAVISSGGLIDKQHGYALFDERVPAGERFDRDRALVELVRRYLASHGPATVHDLGWWSSLTVADLRKALHLLSSEVESETVEGTTFWSAASEGGRPAGRRAAHLLPPYDELIVGYSASRYFGDPRAGAARAAWQDRSLPNGVVFLNGAVAGHWKRVPERRSVSVKVLLYDEPSGEDVRALETAARRLGRFVGRQTTVQAKQL